MIEDGIGFSLVPWHRLAPKKPESMPETLSFPDLEIHDSTSSEGALGMMGPAVNILILRPFGIRSVPIYNDAYITTANRTDNVADFSPLSAANSATAWLCEPPRDTRDRV
jgi:hypothetical protein